MIINNFMGGLGNQLFQIATGYAHAKKINSRYAINYNLNHIGFGQGHHPQKYKDTLYKKIPVTNRETTLVFEEKGFTYRPIVKMDNLCLVGYFQSDKYFKGYENQIKDLLEFEEKIRKKVNQKMSKIKKKKVGVHIRLGDYLHKQYDGVFHNIDYPTYLEKAMCLFDDNYEFLIFSDDLSLIKKTIDLENFIDLKNVNEVEDLFALSQCDSIIMSNSSFSWWGSWLGKSKEIIVSPDQWFGPKGPKDYDDRFSENWIRIQTN